MKSIGLRKELISLISSPKIMMPFLMLEENYNKNWIPSEQRYKQPKTGTFLNNL